MKSGIKERLMQLKKVRADVLAEKTQHVDKSSYIQMIEFNIQTLTDIIILVDAVNSENQKMVSEWFARFRED